MATTRDGDRQSTIQARLGFQDTELATEAHDAIVFWLDRHMQDILAGMLPGFATPWDAGQVEATLERARAHYAARGDEVCYAGPRSKPPPTVTKRWEHPIATDRQFVVGFVDLRVSVEYYRDFSLWYGDAETVYEPPEPSDSRWSSDAHAAWRRGRKERSVVPASLQGKARATVLFEAKSHIKSAGELIRQIRLYQQYTAAPPYSGLPESQFVVVSPDTRYADILVEQGIGFLAYPAPRREETG